MRDLFDVPRAHRLLPRLRTLVFLFSATLFTSSALLFIVEPMIAKMILPLLGGTPAVWNTCMVFYQLVLLAGYLYAHVLSRSFTRSQQIGIHVSLVAVSIVGLPILVTGTALPPVDASPIPWLLATLTRTAGVPLFVISSTSPLLQRWFASTSGRNPYPLYAAGNAGSLLALVMYPALLEPVFTLKRQSVVWAAAYAVFMAFTLACAAYTRRRSTAVETASADAATSAAPTPLPSWSTRTTWIALAAVPSSLMLGVTTFLTTDIAAVPLLWILPLGLYLLTFVLVFAERQIVSHRRMVRLLSLLVIPIITLVTFDSMVTPLAQIALHLSTFFVASMVCHGELARRKPATEHLTLFYLCLAVGGVLGGVFNAIVAPVVFNSIVEYPLMIVLACALGRTSIAEGRRTRWSDVAAPLALGGGTLAMMFLFKSGDSKRIVDLLLVFIIPGVVLFTFRQKPLRFALGVAAMIVASMTYMSAHERVLHRGRSFYGAHRVTLDPLDRYRVFVDGGIVHGAQSTDPAKRREPMTYFHKNGPIGQVFAGAAPERRRRVGVVGLGIGTLAAYSRPNEYWTFYEINPAVVDVARDGRYFTFLQDSTAKTDIVLGDARLSLVRAEDHEFDLLILDAFSSDAVPVHLLTREALALYLEKLSPHGVVVFNISNRYVELRPLLADLASSFGLVCLQQDDLRITRDDIATGRFPSRWLVMARQRADFGSLAADSRWQTVRPRQRQVVWSDEFSNLLSVFKWRG